MILSGLTLSSGSILAVGECVVASSPSPESACTGGGSDSVLGWETVTPVLTGDSRGRQGVLLGSHSLILAIHDQ